MWLQKCLLGLDAAVMGPVALYFLLFIWKPSSDVLSDPVRSVSVSTMASSYIEFHRLFRMFHFVYNLLY